MTFSKSATLMLCVVALVPRAGATDEAADAVERFRANEPHAYEKVVAQGEAAVPGLAGVLRDRTLDTPIRFTAANALGEIGSETAVDPLVESLKDPEQSIRRCAALALGKIGDARASGPLKRLAAQDPYTWRDPADGKVKYLVREAARTALAMLSGHPPPGEGSRKEKEIFLENATELPPSPVTLKLKRLDWPFPGDSRAQNIWNNYQQPTDIYIHAGLDLLQPAGTEVKAVDDGFVSVIGTNYPDWTTHHFFIVTSQRGGKEGWCYTHVDPKTYTFKRSDPVKRGQTLGNLVDFHVGDNKGVDHLHLHFVRFTTGGKGKGRNAADGALGGVEVRSLVDPLLFFDWEDTVAPVIDEPIRFVREGTLKEFIKGDDGVAVVRGAVDIVAGISDQAFDSHGGTWMVPVVTLEITGEKTRTWRKLVLDHRGAIDYASQSRPLYLSHQEKRRFVEGRPPFPVIHFLKVTNTDGDGVIEAADDAQTWDTRKLPDGLYDVTVRAWDLKGNAATRAARVRVDNNP